MRVAIVGAGALGSVIGGLLAEKGADLVGYFVPERGHPLFRHWLRELWARMGQESFIGYTVLIMTFYGALRACRGGLFQSESSLPAVPMSCSHCPQVSC